MKPSLTWAVAVLPLVFSSLARAQAEQTLDPVVVSATRAEQKLADVLPSVSLITRDDIERAQAPTLVDLLQGQTGLEIARNGGPGTNSSIFMRGQASNGVVLFVDGVRMQTDAFGGIKMIDIPPNQIEKIEVLRGNMAAVYGEAATGGVIHISTRAGSAAAGPSATLSYGSRDTGDLALGYQFKQDDWRLGLTAQHFQTRGYSAMNPAQNPYVNPDRDGFKRSAVFLHAEKQLLPQWALGLQAQHLQSRAQYDNDSNPYTGKKAALTDTQHNRNKSSTITLYSNFQPLPDWSARLALTQAKFASKDFYNDLPNGSYSGDQISAQWNNVYSLGTGKFSFGVDTTRARFSIPATYDRNALAFYAGYSGSTGAWDYQANVRHDQIQAKTRDKSVNARAHTWLLGAGYAVTEALKLTALASTSFRAPNTGELFDTAWTKGNPDLKPETHRAYEFGLSWKTDLGRLRVVHFNDDTTNAIAYHKTGRYENIDKTRNRGYELNLEGRAKDWSYKFSVVRQNPVNVVTGARLLRRAQIYGALDVSTQLLGMQWGTKFIASGNRKDYGDDKELPAYRVLHLYASKTLTPSWTARIKLENVFNKKYQLAYGYDAPRRGVFLTLEYQAP